MAESQEQNQEPKNQPKAESNSSKSDPLREAQEASSEYGKATLPDVADEEILDDSAATHVYPADIGYTVTSYGDGTASLSPDYITAREEEAERNADPDRPNKEFARDVLGLDVDLDDK